MIELTASVIAGNSVAVNDGVHGNGKAARSGMEQAQALITPELERVEKMLRNFPSLKPDALREAVEMIVASGGKRLRPVLTLLTAGLFGKHTDPRIISIASAVEMLHTATLVHDDLIDGSLMRRGATTLNAVWTPVATVLTGDYLFAYAAGLAAKANNVQVMTLFSETLGVIVGGELQQSFADWEQRSTREDYFPRIYAKTGSLIVLAVMTAAVIGGADEKQSAALRSYAHNLGLAFQIVDDILDFTGEQARVGKPVGSDLRRGLITLPTLNYASAHPQDELLACAMKGECNTRQYDELVRRISASEAIAASFDEARALAKQASDALLEFTASPFRAALLDLIQYTVVRTA
ncbi:MAG TPA: polyprenyl synthetase family protein [Thermoflexales bacterium]|nr:polyprenyl synthetase family protein [Thermoflexales bacterium]HQW36755.1 polyprenyl synthetase family protein [Thermoflexales bacterium]HQZ21921.1 polyprenyl synthetase family protein [Thermoflexales bacterium]